MKKRTNVRYLVQLSLLAAIELVMAYTPLGYLRVFALEITFLMVPVTLGAILLGPAAGAVLGGVFGLTSFATCFSVSGFGDVLLSINPVFTFLVCVPTRILAGWLAGVLFKAIFAAEQKTGSRHWLSFGAASLAGPVLNTVFFMSALVLFFYQTDFIQGMAQALGAANPLIFVVMFVGFQGVLEAVVGFLVVGVLSKALHRQLFRA